MMNRRGFLAGCLAAGAARAASPAAEPVVADGIAWYTVSDWGVEGRGFDDTARYYDRLPARAEQTVRKRVWELSRDSAGMSAWFETDAPEIHARYRLFYDHLGLPHMPATGVSGLDLYALDGRGRERWTGFAKPVERDVQAKLVEGLDQPEHGPRRFRAYLPLYNGLDDLQIGVPEGARFEPVAPRAEKPIVFYGTSITQGGCASRPGMAFTGILDRRLGRPIINLGFSGNGWMEEEVGAFLTELDPSVYVLDCLANMSNQPIYDRTTALVRRLREARPDVPILLVEDRTDSNAWIRGDYRERHIARRTPLRDAFLHLRGERVPALYYLGGDNLIGDDGEATVDGSHPTDLGMLRYADAFEARLRPLLR